MITTLKNKATLSILARMRQGGAPVTPRRGVTEGGYGMDDLSDPDNIDSDSAEENQLDNIANPDAGIMDSDPDAIMRRQLMFKKKKVLPIVR